MKQTWYEQQAEEREALLRLERGMPMADYAAFPPDPCLESKRQPKGDVCPR